MDFQCLRRSESNTLQVEIRRTETLGPGFLSCVYEDWQGKRRRGMSEYSYINELPDDILAEILSRLEVKDAVKTCVVSCRWRNLWTLSTTYETSSSYSRQYYEYASSGAVVVRYRERASRKDSMIFAFDSEKDGNNNLPDHSTLNDWIHARLSQEPLDQHLLDTSGRLRNARLTALYLDSVAMYSDDFKKYTKLFRNLETLVVVNSAIGFAEVGELLRLKHLEFRYCKYLKQISITLVPNLETLKLASKEKCAIDLWGAIPSISLEGTFCVKMIQKRAIPRVEQLEINKKDLIREMSLINKALPEFRNVKHLKLIFDFCSHLGLMDLALFIKACPSLQKLTLMYGCIVKLRHEHNVDDDDHKKNTHFDEKLMKSYTHHHLQVVEFLGWRGHGNEVLFADFVIKAASHLQDLVFDPSTPQHRDRLGAYTFDQSTREADSGDKKAIECARQLIKKFKRIKSSRA